MSGHRAAILFERLRAMELPPGTYAVFGSGPLAAHGLIDDIGDLDVVVRDDAWDRVRALGTIVMHGNDVVVDLGTDLRSAGHGLAATSMSRN